MRRVNSKRIDLNDSNRLVRTRMPGGVGGDRSDYLYNDMDHNLTKKWSDPQNPPPLDKADQGGIF